MLAVIERSFGGDGWESNPPRTPQQRPADGFEDRGEHQLPYIPSAGYISAAFMTKRMETAVWALVIGVIVLVPSGVMYLATTFLFAFSGGQYRMVPVVNYAALIVVLFGVGTAALTWKLRSVTKAVFAAGATTAGGWVTAVVVEWLLSFQLG